jgi:hypothetical protein
MNLRIFAVIAAVLAWLWHCHVTIWLAGHPVATVPALLLALVLAAAAVIAGVIFLRLLHAHVTPGVAYA